MSNEIITAVCDTCGDVGHVSSASNISGCKCGGWYRVPRAEGAKVQIPVTWLDDAKLFRLTAIVASLRCTSAWLDNGGAPVYAAEQLRKEAKRLEELLGIGNNGVRTDAAPVVGVLASEVRK